ncbi:serine/threonine protein kinase [Chloropicon primus]|uniref:Serine/threonine protein kinase n=2 Tax=Chloropicon primus TaxID=1764295 RepID=A0A5B8MDH1_9CHLO|nr:serine/threonine protein kinase [Chloropicon primus]UPQ97406.1 serine/threonine protein kinase [Chloropicon primus]|eukprot:QDZ18194.1 serine/threonine protein kinase [Chloropicon primus]
MSQSPFKLKTIRSMFSFGSSQPSQEKGSQDRGRLSPKPIRCLGVVDPGTTVPGAPGKLQRKKRSLNLALSQVTLGSPVEGLAASSSFQQASGQQSDGAGPMESHPTAGTQNNMSVSQSQDFFCTPDFVTPNDAQLKIPAPGFNGFAGPGVPPGSLAHPPTRDFTPLGCKRPRSVFDVLMCPENRRSQLQAYSQELDGYRPPGTRVKGGGLKGIKPIPKSPLCVKNPFKGQLANIPGNVQQEDLLMKSDDEKDAEQGKGQDVFDEPQLVKRKRGGDAKRKRRKRKMFTSISGMNNGRYRSDFKEVQKLGYGSFSTVFRCIHRLDGTQYAIKHVKKNLSTSNADIAQALQEVQAYSALGPHPCLLTYHTSWIENSRLYIQLELSDCCLTDYTKQGKTFDEEELNWMLWSSLQALHHMHASGLAHMDVKPDNIHVVGNKYKIGDLGTCTKCVSEDADQPGVSPHCLYREGDARYMAPELLNDNLGHLDKSDIWSLGATAYELARKCPLPMKGDNYREIREENLAAIPSFSDTFFELITRMMRRDPAERPSAAQLMQHRIFDHMRASNHS